MKGRIDSLDYLRGLMAFGIMMYHFFSWSYGHFDAGTFLGKLGIYGVSVFYVLSGLTLYLVYNDRLSLQTIKSFFIKRVFRILPLIWLCIALYMIILTREYDFWRIILNLSGLFGFIYIDQYIPTAAWSIGNELVFYTIFPLVMIFQRKFKFTVTLYFILSLAATFLFAFGILDETQSLSDQWKTYINPFNQILLFAGGMMIGHYFKNKHLSLPIGISLIILASLLFIFYPSTGDQISIVSGLNRLVFVGISFIVTMSFYTLNMSFGKSINFILSKLGEISYSLYLLHPFVFAWIMQIFGYGNVPEEYAHYFIISSIFFTILLSLLVYNHYEKRFIAYSRKLAKKT